MGFSQGLQPQRCTFAQFSSSFQPSAIRSKQMHQNTLEKPQLSFKGRKTTNQPSNNSMSYRKASELLCLVMNGTEQLLGSSHVARKSISALRPQSFLHAATTMTHHPFSLHRPLTPSFGTRNIIFPSDAGANTCRQVSVKTPSLLSHSPPSHCNLLKGRRLLPNSSSPFRSAAHALDLSYP